ncbi:SDR family NAD(P)-dependent oxidoreductase, partial [Klebsiella pneumoniae]|nr:SDR family NAD(P)-dependent oxidoreductase [Klebsiella pneumoniae]
MWGSLVRRLERAKPPRYARPSFRRFPPCSLSASSSASSPSWPRSTSSSSAGLTEPARGAALVTGAARRIGREIALHAARAGWDVAIHHGSSPDDAEAVAAGVRALDRRAAVLQADLADPEATRALV